jgi:hypothetical protein
VLVMKDTFQQFHDVREFEEVLACNIKDVVADLCLADTDIIMSYATKQLHGNMDEIIMSSTELYFKDRTLSYAYGVDVSLEWGPPPCVALDMEFIHDSVGVLFKLVLGQQYVGVQINQMRLNETVSERDFDVRSFERVITSARVQPLPERFAPHYRPESATRH